MKVLIVKLSALGDVVQALPVAMSIKQQAPQARVDWLVERPSKGLLMGHPALERVIESPRHDIWGGSGSMITAVSGFGRELRQVRYDAVLDLQGLMKSAIFVALCRAGRKIGFKGGKEPLAAWPLTQRLAPYDPERPALERYLDLLAPLGLMRPARPSFGLEPTAQEAARARELAGGGDTGGGERPLVVLHPVAKWETKLWPPAHWVALVKGLKALSAEGPGFDLAFTGSAADRKLTQAVIQAAGGGVADLAGRTSLRELAAVLARARLVVSTDTGAMHLAAAVGTKVVALFGPTAPWRTGPHGTGHRILRLGLDCSPCFRRECDEPRCLKELKPRAVLDAVNEMLSPSGAA